MCVCVSFLEIIQRTAQSFVVVFVLSNMIWLISEFAKRPDRCENGFINVEFVGLFFVFDYKMLYVENESWQWQWQFKWQFCALLQLDLSAKNAGKYEQENAFNLLRH